MMDDEAKKRKERCEQLKKQFRQNGSNAISDRDLLELLLFYCTSRQDTAPLADKMIDLSGSFSNVCDLPVQSMKDTGLNFSATAFLHLLPALCSRYYTKISHQQMEGQPLNHIETIGKYLFPYFIGQQEEHVLLLLLNKKDRQVYCNFISKGTTFSSDINSKNVLQTAVKYKACTAVLAHNHPSGIALPSKQDIEATLLIQNALNIVGVKLRDHYIFGNTDFCAMSTIKRLADIFT